METLSQTTSRHIRALFSPLKLVVCGVLLALILPPIDGRLKYAEVLPGDTLESLLRRPVLAANPTDQALGDLESASGADTIDQIDSEDVPGDGKGALTELVGRVPRVGESALSCFPPADLTHKYDWARFSLRHLAEKSWGKEPMDRRPQLPGEEEQALDGDDAGLPSSVKRSDYNRELSVDLYTQFPSSCACQTKYELLDLGYTHFPRYIMNAICQNRSANSRKCWRGSSCKEIPYKVRVLTRRADNESSDVDHHSTLLPEPLREYWRFKTVTIAAACQCSI